MAHEQHQYPHVKEIARHAHILLAQHLAGAGLPGVGLALEAYQAAEQEHRAGDVGTDTASAAAWVLFLLPWAQGVLAIYLRPRVDGKPG